VAPQQTEKPKSSEKKKATFKEKQEYEKLQAEIEQLENKKIELTSLLNSGTTDHQQLQKWSDEIKAASDSIDQKTLRWLELSELMEG
jgi:ATP-binding cassette subfamily F protein uup